MPVVSTKLLCLLTLVLVLAVFGGVGAADWPLMTDIDLSSGFGDYRPGHFHFGIDLRTGGVTGKRVVSPVDGWVWRVRTEYRGYGKALYIRGDDGYTYVLAHLKDFARPVDDDLKRRQVDEQRYYQDYTYPPDSIRVEQGKLVAWSGQTGSGAPHLHFEKRAGDVPLNPLTHGYTLNDRTRPVFVRLGLELRDDHTIFQNGGRKMFLEAVEAGQRGKYGVDTLFYLSAPVGLVVETFDLMRPGGMRQGVHDLSLYIDGDLLYRSRLDSVDFGTNRSCALEYDYLEAVEKRKYVRRLYHRRGNAFAGSAATGLHDGVIGSGGELKYGPHTALIVAEDAYGNRSELEFRFVQGPSPLFELDSTHEVASDTVDFFLRHGAPGAIEVDSLVPLLTRRDSWGITEDASISMLEDDMVRVRAVGNGIDRATLALGVFIEGGGSLIDKPFNGIARVGAPKATIEHEVVDDGLIVWVHHKTRYTAQSRLRVYGAGQLLGVEEPQIFTMNTHGYFIKPQRRYRSIDRFEVMFTPDTTDRGVFSDSLRIVAVGFEPQEEIAVDDLMTLRLGEDVFFEPRFIEVKKNRVFDKTSLKLMSDHYQILPEAFVTRRDFEVHYDYRGSRAGVDLSGLCWLDTEKDKWVWLDNVYDSAAVALTAASTGGGSFATVVDDEAPRITGLTVAPGRTYTNRTPAINFVIEDTLSGIGDDRDILIELDGEWLIPEYEPETGAVRSRPLSALESGEHHLGVIIRDRAGNKTEQYVRFNVR